MPVRISKANDAAQEEIGGAEPGPYYSCPASPAGMMRCMLIRGEGVKLL